MLEPIIPCDHPRGPDLTALRSELQRHWCAETSFWPDGWTPDRPSFGQCAVTAMIVHDRFGGEMFRTVNEGVIHYWNRVDDIDIDLTRDQFDTWAPEGESSLSTLIPSDRADQVSPLGTVGWQPLSVADSSSCTEVVGLTTGTKSRLCEAVDRNRRATPGS